MVGIDAASTPMNSASLVYIPSDTPETTKRIVPFNYLAASSKAFEKSELASSSLLNKKIAELFWPKIGSI